MEQGIVLIKCSSFGKTKYQSNFIREERPDRKTVSANFVNFKTGILNIFIMDCIVINCMDLKTKVWRLIQLTCF
jgi:hypothetical protein